jgi:gas vesicle protein
MKGIIMPSNINAKGFLIGFIAGGTIGTIITLLTNPKSGKEFRSDIKQKSGEYFDEADKYFVGIKNKTSQMIAEAKRKYALVIQDIKSKPEDILNDVEQNIRKAEEKINDVLYAGKEETESKTEKLKSSVKSKSENSKKKTRNKRSSK